MAHLCESCDFWSTSEEDLKTHIYQKHQVNQNKMVYVCPMCGKEFVENSDYKQHLSNIHTQIKDHETGLKGHFLSKDSCTSRNKCLEGN